MHTYPSYRAPSGEAIVDFVKQNPFAIVATSTEGAPVATHVPIVVPPDVQLRDSLVGARLWGHLGRDNPHWKLFADRPETLFIFSSSHAYVSPSNYGFTPAAPTLDYATVHLTGRVSILEGERANLDVVEQTVAQLEGRRASQWNPEGSRDLFKKIIGGVVSFEIRIDTERAMFKLSQDMPDEVHARVQEDLAHGEHRHPDVADLMGRIGVTSPSQRD